MKKFIYSVVQKNWTEPLSHADLNAYGDVGWELVSIIKTGSRDELLEYYFKKEFINSEKYTNDEKLIENAYK